MGNPGPERHTGVRRPSRFLRVDKAVGFEGSFSRGLGWRELGSEGVDTGTRRGEGVLEQGSVSRIICHLTRL